MIWREFMLVDSLSFNLFIPKINNIRGSIERFEDALKEDFATPFTILPIPDDAPEEIPRIIAKSRNGHSELSISLINANLKINYDNNFNRSYEMCFEYIKGKIDILLDVFSEIVDDKYIFAGMLGRIIVDNITEPIEFLESKFCNINANIKPYNFSEKITYILDDIYFLNFNIYNLRTYEGIVSEQSMKPDVNQTSHNIAIDIDINDKYGYNHNKTYVSSRKSIENIIEIAKRNIIMNINNILNEGELKLNG